MKSEMILSQNILKISDSDLMDLLIIYREEESSAVLVMIVYEMLYAWQVG